MGGCAARIGHPLEIGTAVRIEGLPTKSVTCRVVNCISLGKDEKLWLLGWHWNKRATSGEFKHHLKIGASDLDAKRMIVPSLGFIVLFGGESNRVLLEGFPRHGLIRAFVYNGSAQGSIFIHVAHEREYGCDIGDILSQRERHRVLDL
jgi:hypothetical protein